MKCSSCGAAMTVAKVSADRCCFICGLPYQFEVDDFTLHGFNAPGREVRPGQVEMARVVERVIKNKSIAIIEGPVGVGKSDGYGIPAALHAAYEQKKRIVISTAKKQLQHQIARKDLPAISKRIERNLRIGLMKGKSNYACRYLARGLPDEQKNQFLRWIEESSYGDTSEFPGRLPNYWYKITAENCIGPSCTYAKDVSCGFWRARQESKAASLVVTNHHVVAFDLLSGPYKVLGPYDVLVIDEAHQAPSSFRAAFTTNITHGSCKRLLDLIDLADLETGLEAKFETRWEAMFQKINSLSGLIPPDPFGQLGEAVAEYLATVDTAAKALGTKAASEDPPDAGAVANCMAVRKLVDKIQNCLRNAKDPGDNSVVSVSETAPGKKMLTVSPISVGPYIGPKLQIIPSTIITSATIALGDSFSDIRRQLGLNFDNYGTIPAKDVEELVIESPFNYKEQALLYVPKHLPLPATQASDPKEREVYLAALTSECTRLLKASKGNAFILCTATTDLTELYERLSTAKLPYKLIPQLDDAESAFKEFLATPNSVILGLKSFWEGVDVVGDKLRLVIITKLPFPSPADPLMQAQNRQLTAKEVARGVPLAKAEKAGFQVLQVPAMLTDLRQGAGRLIRSKADKGVLAILDCRVWTGSGKRTAEKATRHTGYGQQVIDALGFPQRVSDFEIVKRILTTWEK